MKKKPLGGDEITFSGSEREALKNADLETAMLLEKVRKRKREDVFRSSLFVSGWMLGCVDIAKEHARGISDRKLTMALLNLGTILIAKKVEKRDIDFRKMRYNILHGDNRIAFKMAATRSVEFGEDSLIDPRRIFVYMADWAMEDMGVMSAPLSIQRSSMRRIAMCYAFNTNMDMFSKYLQEEITKHIKTFEEYVVHVGDFFKMLERMGEKDIMEEKQNEEESE